MPDAMNRKKINLALQGGGAYGAFTWGVLDYLLEDGRLEIEGITGASAGAVNAIMLVDGLVRASAAICRSRNARRSIACSRSCRSRIRRSVSGSRRCPNISRPTTSIRSTSIR
jgi:predicted patatin/cPLA2 family phospholipase